jgi:uncharacterized protein YecE (DUF72 family)
MTMELLTGTSGYSYKEWLGRFYPEKLAASAMLRYYAGRFNTVEINNTFYRMPAESMLARWAEEVPADFIFTLKAPQRITHVLRLKEAQPAVAEFLRRASALGDKFRIAFFQLPPYLKKDVSRLRDFLGALSSDRVPAFEFRHASWHDDEVYETLRAHNAALCVADTDDGETPLVATSKCGYYRLRRTHYDDDQLRGWVKRITAQPHARVCVYFKHEDEARGTVFAHRFVALWRAETASL